MRVCYSIFIQFYSIFLHAASFFNKKAEKWIIGRKNWEENLSKKLTKVDIHYWIHCASAGEFEQAIPMMNRIRSQKSGIRIAISFFSPSGFEMYKDSGLADLFFYFPLDTTKNAEKLIKILNPAFVIFIRNEIWWNILRVLKEKNIPAYLVNANPEQKRSFCYQYYLNKTYPLFIKIFDTANYGNTKLERVIKSKNEIYRDDFLEDFCKDSLVIILGSSWKVEESLIALFYKKYLMRYANLKIIVVPHEYGKNKFNELKKTFSDWQASDVNDVIEYSNYNNRSNKRILFFDKKGVLKYAYRYAHIAFIGGGFDKTVHNISEAAVYGMPTLFGPNYIKFEEAIELTNLQAAFPVGNYTEFETKLLQLINDSELRKNISKKLTTYFSQQNNSSEKIISEILK